MTLDEAIRHEEEVAERYTEEAERFDSDVYDIMKVSCKQCAEDHRQLAMWLKELKERRQAERDER